MTPSTEDRNTTWPLLLAVMLPRKARVTWKENLLLHFNRELGSVIEATNFFVYFLSIYAPRERNYWHRNNSLVWKRHNFETKQGIKSLHDKSISCSLACGIPSWVPAAPTQMVPSRLTAMTLWMSWSVWFSSGLWWYTPALWITRPGSPTSLWTWHMKGRRRCQLMKMRDESKRLVRG